MLERGLAGVSSDRFVSWLDARLVNSPSLAQSDQERPEMGDSTVCGGYSYDSRAAAVDRMAWPARRALAGWLGLLSPVETPMHLALEVSNQDRRGGLSVPRPCS